MSTIFLTKQDTRMKILWVLLVEHTTQTNAPYIGGIPMGKLTAIKVLINGPRNSVEGLICLKY